MIAHFRLQQLFLSIFFFSVFIFGCKLDKIDGLVPLQPRGKSACLIQISGKVLDTRNLAPLPNVQIQSTHFTIETDLNGEFEIALKQRDIEGLDEILVSKEGYLENNFFANYASLIDATNCSEVISLDWEISLSPKQKPQWVDAKGIATFHIMDTIAFAQPIDSGEVEIIREIRDYMVKIKKGTVEEWTNLSISPNNGTAFGAGIVLSEDMFSLVRFVVENKGGISPDRLVTAIPNEMVKFQQPIEISFNTSAGLFEQRNQELPSLDLGNITKNELGKTNLVGNRVKTDLFATGNLYIGLKEETTDLMLNMLGIIEEKGREAAELIESLFNEFINSSQNENISITSSTPCVGAIVDQQIFSNCDCSEAKVETFKASTRNFANVNIQFPNGTPNNVRRRALNIIRSLYGGGNGQLKVTYSVFMPKCTNKIITSTEHILKVEGIVLGFPFTYEGLSNLETTEDILTCPITSACHQGCPN